MHGGFAKDALGDENVDAVKKGCANLGRHISNVKKFGVPAVIAINRFVKDTDAELKAIQEFAKTQGVEAVACEHWGKGSEGTEELAHKVAALADGGTANFKPLYDETLPLFDKIDTLCNQDRKSVVEGKRGERRVGR